MRVPCFPRIPTSLLWGAVRIFALLLPSACLAGTAAMPADVPRLLVLTDIEADPDDTQSLVRLLLYSDVVEIEGLVATTSTWMRTTVAPDSIQAVIRAYAKVHGNLLLHDANFPAPESLQTLVKTGRPEYGMAGVGEGKDTEGSDWIIRCLERDDARPLWITVWGGTNTLAQALYKLRATRAPAEVDRLVARLRVHTISDQDDSGPWIRKEFPALFYIVAPGGNYGDATWPAINSFVDGIDNTTIGNRWLAAHIQQGHGPLGAAYPDVAWGMEGDTPSFLGLIPNGLNTPEHPHWGGWGGRYEFYRPEVKVADPSTFIGGVPIPPETRAIWTTAVDEYTPPQYAEYGRPVVAGAKTFRDARTTLWRWRDDFQHDFAARMDWTIQPYAQANHPPVPALAHPDAFTVRSGEGFTLSARGSTDPDGDSLSYFWSAYPEAGTSKEPAKFEGSSNTIATWIVAPKVERTGTLHFILRVTDKGTPALTRYKRVIVTVEP